MVGEAERVKMVIVATGCVVSKNKNGLLLKERIEKKGCHMRGVLDTTNEKIERRDLKVLLQPFTSSAFLVEMASLGYRCEGCGYVVRCLREPAMT